MKNRRVILAAVAVIFAAGAAMAMDFIVLTVRVNPPSTAQLKTIDVASPCPTGNAADCVVLIWDTRANGGAGGYVPRTVYTDAAGTIPLRTSAGQTPQSLPHPTYQIP